MKDDTQFTAGWPRQSDVKPPAYHGRFARQICHGIQRYGKGRVSRPVTGTGRNRPLRLCGRSFRKIGSITAGWPGAIAAQVAVHEVRMANVKTNLGARMCKFQCFVVEWPKVAGRSVWAAGEASRVGLLGVFLQQFERLETHRSPGHGNLTRGAFLDQANQFAV
jgi:hypothetical protein